MTKWDRRVTQAAERLRGPERLAPVVLPDELHEDDRLGVESVLRAALGRADFSMTMRVRIGDELQDLHVCVHDGQPSLRYASVVHNDSVTGLPLREAAIDHLATALQACPPERYIGLVLINIDRFHSLNYSSGLAVGDEALQSIAASLTSALGKDDYLARVGSDEFAAIIPGLRSMSEAFAVSESLRTSIRSTARNRTLTMSAGVSLGDATNTATQLMVSADVALRAAKKGGGDRLRALDEKLRDAAVRNAAIDERLRAALDGKQLAIHYQPVFDVRTLRVVGFESLLRLTDGGDLITTGDLLRAALESGLARRLETEAIGLTIEQFRGWQQHPLGADIDISINMGPLPTRDRQSALTLRRIIEHSGMRASQLVVEVSEAAITNDHTTAAESFAILRSAGVKIAIDGFSGNPPMFEVLHALAPDSIKLRRGLVRLMQTERGAVITHAIVRMCQSMGLSVTAVGVEEGQQLERVRAMGCDRVQGYLLAPPMPYELAVPFVQSKTATDLRDHL